MIGSGRAQHVGAADAGVGVDVSVGLFLCRERHEQPREERVLETVREIPGVGKVTEQKLNALGIHTVSDIAARDDSYLEQHLGKWELDVAGKARGEDAGAWFDGEIGTHEAAKSISHEHTYNEDTASLEQIEATLMRLSEMVARRLREQNFFART